MFGNRMKYAFLAFAVFALIGYSGCILSPDEEAPQPQPKPTYKSLTEKENIIFNLMQCYKEHNLTRYEELLDPGFVWHNQDDTFNDRAKDVEQTGKMFSAADGKYPDPLLWLDKLEVSISQPGTWYKMTDLDGVPCDDCWDTTRDYYITAVISGGSTTYIGNDRIRFIAIGVMKGNQKVYLLRHMYDTKQ